MISNSTKEAIQKQIGNIFKDSNKDTRTTSKPSLWYLYRKLFTYFIPFSNISLDDLRRIVRLFLKRNYYA